MFHMQSTYLLKLTVRLTLQFVSLSPFNVRVGQTRSLGLKVWGSRLLFILYFLIKKFLGKTKCEEAQKNLGRIALKCPPWLHV